MERINVAKDVAKALLDKKLNSKQRIIDSKQRIIDSVLPLLSDGWSNTEWELLDGSFGDGENKGKDENEDEDDAEVGVYKTVMALWRTKPDDLEDILAGPKTMTEAEWRDGGKPDNVAVQLIEDVVMFNTPSSLAGVSLERPRLFVRRTVRDLMKFVFNQVDKDGISFCRIIGTTGIGKSRSIDYALWLGIHQRRVVFVCNTKRTMVYAMVPDEDESKPPIVLQIRGTRWDAGSVPVLCRHASLGGRPLYLYDPKEEGKVGLESLRANMLVFVSPNPRIVPGADKDLMDHFFMPMWKLPEILAVREHIAVDAKTLISVETVEARFRKFGGAPRQIFKSEDKLVFVRNALKVAIKRTRQMSVCELVHAMPERGLVLFSDEHMTKGISNKLLRCEPETDPATGLLDFTTATFDFLTQEVKADFYEWMLPTGM